MTKGGVLGLPRLSPLLLFITLLFIGSFLSIFLTSSDPWWRPKEWWAFGCGILWMAYKVFNPPQHQRIYVST